MCNISNILYTYIHVEIDKANRERISPLVPPLAGPVRRRKALSDGERHGADRVSLQPLHGTDPVG